MEKKYVTLMGSFFYRLLVIIVFGLAAISDISCGGGSGEDTNEFEIVKSNKDRKELSNENPPDLAELVAGNTAFAIHLFQKLSKDENNLFFSPYSISLGLVMIYAGARNQTEQQMAETLHFTLPQDRLHTAFNDLDHKLASREKSTEGDGFHLKITNSIWGQKDYFFQMSFLDVLAENYGAWLQTLDFQSEPERCRNIINNWISNQTEHKIENLLLEDAVSSATCLVLTNVIYFNAAWKNPFEAEYTENELFYLLDNSEISVQMMSQSNFFNYTADDDYQAIELLYDGEKLSMVILMPNMDKFEEFENELTVEQLDTISNEFEDTYVNLKLPKFTYKPELSLSLCEILADMGMPDAFTSDADFSGVDGTRNLFISDVAHKGFISVDEKGTEVTAASGIVLLPIGPNSVKVAINQPFIFFIRDIETKTILFIGKIVNPNGLTI